MRRKGVLGAALLAAMALTLIALCFQVAAHRGTETDLFPRWYGLRQLLLHGRNPYDDAVTREIAAQTSFLVTAAARPPAATDPAATDPAATDPAATDSAATDSSGLATGEDGAPRALETAYGFLYPLPGALLLAPLALLPYHAALALWLAAGMVALPAAALAALTAVRPAAPPATRLLAIPLAVLYLPALWNVVLAQPGLLVVALVATTLRLASSRPALAGAALAGAALLKPQLVALLAPLWLAHHLVIAAHRPAACGGPYPAAGTHPGRQAGDAWQTRRGHRADEAHVAGTAWQAGRSRRFLWGAAVTGGTLTLAAFALVPSWARDFATAASAYVDVEAMAPASPALYVALGVVLPDQVARAATAALAIALAGWAAAAWWPARGTPRTGAGLAGECASPVPRGVYRALVAGTLVVPPAWETSAVMLIIPLAITLAGLRGPAAVAFVVASAVLSALLAPLSLVWPWRNGAAVGLATALLLVTARFAARSRFGRAAGVAGPPAPE